jgi:hypothetical protein
MPEPSPFALQLTELALRIDKAESARDAWSRAGNAEKYLEACSMVDALELQLSRLKCGPYQQGHMR